MTTLAIFCGIVYAVVAGIWGFDAVEDYQITGRRREARQVFLTPISPIILIVGLARTALRSTFTLFKVAFGKTR